MSVYRKEKMSRGPMAVITFFAGRIVCGGVKDPSWPTCERVLYIIILYYTI